MLNFTPVLSHSEPDPALLDRLSLVKRACVAGVAIIAVLTLCAWFIAPLGWTMPGGWRLMKATTALALLFSAISLDFSESKHPRWMARLSMLPAVLVTLLAAAVLIEYAFQNSLGIDTLLPYEHVSGASLPGRFSPQTGAGLLLLGISMILIQARKRFAVLAADVFAFALCLLVLVLVSGYIFNAMRIFGLSSENRTSPQTLLCLSLMTMVVLLRRSENGVFSIFLGRGIGGRIARILAPILLVVSFLREFGRAHLVLALRIPEHYATAILASTATIVALALLLIIAWHIDGMERDIQDLSLRDELTGLFNLRGFYLLAEQAQRLAQRSQLPFSVLFIDLDNLKQINDSLGHSAGSAFLAETAQLLKATFRETDVMGRIGGDEFAVACQCSHLAILVAAQRLQAAAALRNAEAGRRFPLAFSLGYVTAEEHGDQSLKELLIEADKAMYEEKRRAKQERGGS